MVGGGGGDRLRLRGGFARKDGVGVGGIRRGGRGDVIAVVEPQGEHRGGADRRITSADVRPLAGLVLAFDLHGGWRGEYVADIGRVDPGGVGKRCAVRRGGAHECAVDRDIGRERGERALVHRGLHGAVDGGGDAGAEGDHAISKKEPRFLGDEVRVAAVGTGLEVHGGGADVSGRGTSHERTQAGHFVPCRRGGEADSIFHRGPWKAGMVERGDDIVGAVFGAGRDPSNARGEVAAAFVFVIDQFSNQRAVGDRFERNHGSAPSGDGIVRVRIEPDSLRQCRGGRGRLDNGGKSGVLRKK